MKTLAVLADIHGNRIALEAVLNDLQQQGNVDHMMVLGDLAVFGPDPAGVISLLQEYEPIYYVCGNTDRYLVEERYPTHADDDSWQSRVLASFPWTARQLGPAGLAFLSRLPKQQLLNFTGEHPLLAVHGSPRSDEENILPDMPEAELGSILAAEGTYSLLLCAHTHVPLDRTVAGRRVLNVGSVGLPFDADPRASYALIHLIPGGDYKIKFRRVAYDVEAVVNELENVAHPAAQVQAFNLRTARRLDPNLIYTPQMRHANTAPAEPCKPRDFQSAVLITRLAQLTNHIQKLELPLN